MNFKTLSGSKYQVDLEKKQIRRLFGNAPPTDRQGADQEWKDYTDLSPLKIGEGALIVWKYIDGIAKFTLTSPIIEFI